jgi:hypothetical protein
MNQLTVVWVNLGSARLALQRTQWHMQERRGLSLGLSHIRDLIPAKSGSLPSDFL